MIHQVKVDGLSSFSISMDKKVNGGSKSVDLSIFYVGLSLHENNNLLTYSEIVLCF